MGDESAQIDFDGALAVLLAHQQHARYDSQCSLCRHDAALAHPAGKARACRPKLRP